jgi:hypothetical protein
MMIFYNALQINSSKQMLNLIKVYARHALADIMRGSCKLNVGVVEQMGCLAAATLTLTQRKKDGCYRRTILKNH